MRLGHLLLIVFFSLCGRDPARADGFRCPKNDHLIGDGDSMKEVIVKCGPPAKREDLVTSSCTENGVCERYKIGEQWTYNFGPYYLTRILTFHRETLVKVDEGGYGK
jgi:hypothetical protein